MKLFSKITISILLTSFLLTPVAYAQIIPQAASNCSNYVSGSDKDAFVGIEKFKIVYQRDKGVVLGCAIKTGYVRLYMIPYFVTYIIQYLLGIAGLIAVLFMVYGGFTYVTGGISEDKETGKKVIMHALIGLIISLSAWIIVNFVQVALTS
jgi:hypothetical protein